MILIISNHAQYSALVNALDQFVSSAEAGGAGGAPDTLELMEARAFLEGLRARRDVAFFATNQDAVPQ